MATSKFMSTSSITLSVNPVRVNLTDCASPDHNGLHSLIIRLYQEARLSQQCDFRAWMFAELAAWMPFQSGHWSIVSLGIQASAPGSQCGAENGVSKLRSAGHGVGLANPQEMTLQLTDDDAGLLHTLSLRRERTQPCFSALDRQLLGWLMPHLHEALRIWQANRLRQTAFPGKDLRQSFGLCDTGGLLHYADPGFLALLRREWPDWQGRRLPRALLNLLEDKLPVCCEERWMTIRIEIFQEEQHSLPTDFGFITHYPTLLRISARCCLGDQTLTPREQEITMLLVRGLSIKAIARQLGISPSTVNNHASRIYEKLGVHGRRELSQRIRA